MSEGLDSKNLHKTAESRQDLDSTTKSYVKDFLDKIKNVLDSRDLGEIPASKLPEPHTIKGINEASEIIANAMSEGRKIAFVGDYDVDGVSSLCIVKYFFEMLGYDITTKIPNRFKDGYGINCAMIDELDCELYITLDNGIVAFDVADKCRELGKTLIITDHHKPLIENGIEKLPNAIVINPNQEDCNFAQSAVCGAFVAWYLCVGIKQNLTQKNLFFGAMKPQDIDLAKLTPFVALATISDVMPLVSLNRTIYKHGMKKIKESKIPSFAFLSGNFKMSVGVLGFSVIPVLNSAGRLDSAEKAFDFLCSRSIDEASERFAKLVEINNERKSLQDEVLQLAQTNLIKTKNFIVAFGDFSTKEGLERADGVLGIVAARLADNHNLSAFCLNLCDGELHGSGRGRNGVDLIGSLQKMQSQNAILSHFGGHKSAVGLSLKSENLDLFVKLLQENIILDSSDTMGESEIELRLCAVGVELLELLESYEPYGSGNEELKFIVKNAKVIQTQEIGKDKNHLKLTLSQDGEREVMALLFNIDKSGVSVEKDSAISFKCGVSRSLYGEAQLVISEIL